MKENVHISEQKGRNINNLVPGRHLRLLVDSYVPLGR